jgi:CheY-like chemotaxis protein
MTVDKPKLLLVEDDPVAARVVSMALPEFDVVIAPTRERAFELLLGETDWCCALVDLNLTRHSDLRGKDVLDHLQTTDIPRAVLTGARGLGDIRRNFEERYGVSTVLIKGPNESIQLSDIRACVARMRDESVRALRKKASEYISQAFAMKEAKIKDELRQEQNITSRAQRIIGDKAARDIAGTEIALLNEGLAALPDQCLRFLEDIEAAVSSTEISVIIQRAESAIETLP